jgi:hypothetical protein
MAGRPVQKTTTCFHDSHHENLRIDDIFREKFGQICCELSVFGLLGLFLDCWEAGARGGGRRHGNPAGAESPLFTV